MTVFELEQGTGLLVEADKKELQVRMRQRPGAQFGGAAAVLSGRCSRALQPRRHGCRAHVRLAHPSRNEPAGVCPPCPQEEVSCLQVAPVPEGLVRASFLAVGTFDQTVRVLSLDPGSGLRNLAVQVRQPAAARCSHRQANGPARPGAGTGQQQSQP